VTFSRWKQVGPIEFVCSFCGRIAVTKDDMLACGGGCSTREERERARQRKQDKTQAAKEPSLF
jgi:hypothetical protein